MFESLKKAYNMMAYGQLIMYALKIPKEDFQKGNFLDSLRS